MSKPEIKHRKTYEIRFTKFELLHLRDLFSISLPPEGKQTISNALATLENRQMIESHLWKKIAEACEKISLPTGDDAPDYVIAPTGIAPLGVFQLASEPSSLSDEDDDEEEDDDDEVDDEAKNAFKSLFMKKG